MIDYVGQWFAIYRQMGEPTDIFFETEKNGIHNLYSFPHEKSDGSGALFKLAEAKNWKIYNDLPKKIFRKPSKFRSALNVILFIFWNLPRRRQPWKFKVNKAHETTTLFSSFGFDLKLSQRLAKKKDSYSLNSLIFYCLNLAVAETFDFDSSLKSWWIPVNMRPDLGLDVNDNELQKNYVSNFTVSVNHLVQLRDYQNLITKYLKQQRHWATWHWQHIGKLVPEKILEKILFSKLSSDNYVGTFSNLGQWTSSDKETQVKMLIPPIRSHPIGASALMWNGQLNIGLRIYPTFPLSQKNLDNLMQLWVEKIILKIDP